MLEQPLYRALRPVVATGERWGGVGVGGGLEGQILDSEALGQGAYTREHPKPTPS